MTKDHKLFQEWVIKMFEKYKPILFIEKYSIKVEPDKKGRYMASEFNYPYLDAKILYSDEALYDWKNDKKDAERRIVHEFSHIITDPFYCMAIESFIPKQQIEDARERLTDHIAQIINKHFNF